MHRFPKTFLWASLSALRLICSISLGETPHVTQTGNTTSPPLEIQVSPLRWENACLLVGLDLTNHSNVPVFFDCNGPLF
jgi:hypothetical protein